MVGKVQLIGYKEAGTAKPIQTVDGYTFTFSRNPEKIERNIDTEWRVRHIGTRPYKRYRWRRRETQKIRIKGGLYMDELQNLEKLVRMTEGRGANEGYVYKIVNAKDFGIGRDSDEWYVIDSPLRIRTGEKGKYAASLDNPSESRFIPFCEYTLEMELIYKDDI